MRIPSSGPTLPLASVSLHLLSAGVETGKNLIHEFSAI